LLELGVMATTLNAIPPLVIETTFVVGALLVVALISVSGAAGPDGLPLLAVFTYAAFRLIPAINRFTWRINTIRGNAASILALHADFTAIKQYADQPAPAERPRRSWQRLTLDRVTFGYEGGPAILREITCDVRCGETVGIVGATGAGKTTLIDVLLGLLTPTAGHRLVDGVAAGADHGPRAAYVPQSVFVADDVLARNVAFAIDARLVDDDRLQAAIRAAQLAPLVEQWPDGVDTMLGERGARLSGGERQRVGIARALYHDPDLLVLDEATSALDSATEARVLDAIQALRLTTVIVAHRLSTIARCDRLLYIVDGAVAGQGSFDQLMRGNASFRALVEAADVASRVP
jgi:ATP-binding cassette subfamily C protein